MKKALYIGFILLLTVILGFVILSLAGCNGNIEHKIVRSYDSNDAAYRYIPPAPNDWREKFGDNERTRLLHTISELRVQVALQGRRILAIEKKIAEPNEVQQ